MGRKEIIRMYCDQCGHSEDQDKEMSFGRPTPFVNWIELIVHDRPHCKPSVSHRYFCKPGCLHKFLKIQDGEEPTSNKVPEKWLKLKEAAEKLEKKCGSIAWTAGHGQMPTEEQWLDQDKILTQVREALKEIDDA